MNLSLVVSRQCLTGNSRTGRAFDILSFKCILQPKRKSSPHLNFLIRINKHDFLDDHGMLLGIWAISIPSWSHRAQCRKESH